MGELFSNGVDPTRHTFRVPDVGRVVVEIGDVVRKEGDVGRYDHRHSYPEYRVAVEGTVAMEGTDWGVPAGKCINDVDAALALLFWVAHDSGDEAFELWVYERQVVRATLSAPGREGDPRAVVRAVYAGQL